MKSQLSIFDGSNNFGRIDWMDGWWNHPLRCWDVCRKLDWGSDIACIADLALNTGTMSGLHIGNPSYLKGEDEVSKK